MPVISVIYTPTVIWSDFHFENFPIVKCYPHLNGMGHSRLSKPALAPHSTLVWLPAPLVPAMSVKQDARN